MTQGFRKPERFLSEFGHKCPPPVLEGGHQRSQLAVIGVCQLVFHLILLSGRHLARSFRIFLDQFANGEHIVDVGLRKALLLPKFLDLIGVH
jgi:hypothetical protein